MLTRKQACEQLQKFGEREQASPRLNFASKSSKDKILLVVKNFNGPFITPTLKWLSGARAQGIIAIFFFSYFYSTMRFKENSLPDS